MFQLADHLIQDGVVDTGLVYIDAGGVRDVGLKPEVLTERSLSGPAPANDEVRIGFQGRFVERRFLEEVLPVLSSELPLLKLA